LAINPRKSTPSVAIRGVDLTKRCGNNLNARIFLAYFVHHAEESTGLKFGLRSDFGSGDSQTHLQILFIAYQHIHVLDDSVENRYSMVMASGHVPESGPVIQIKRDYCTRVFGCLHAFDGQFGGG